MFVRYDWKFVCIQYIEYTRLLRRYLSLLYKFQAIQLFLSDSSQTLSIKLEKLTNSVLWTQFWLQAEKDLDYSICIMQCIWFPLEIGWLPK